MKPVPVDGGESIPIARFAVWEALAEKPEVIDTSDDIEALQAASFLCN